MKRLLFLLACGGVLHGAAHQSVAGVRTRATFSGKVTRFGYAGDRHAGGAARCLGRPVAPGEPGIAHRTLPCGTLVRIRNHRTGCVTVAPVVDRGPYGAMHDGAWVLKRRASDPGVWRGVADLTPATFAALGAKSFDRVTVEVLP